MAKRMLREGRIGQELHDAAIERHRRTGRRFEETLLECGMSEERLLRSLAEMYRVQYISTRRLGGAKISSAVLHMIPRKIVETRQVVPVLLDRQKGILSIVTSNPQDIEALKEVEIASQARTIRPLVARPAAISAAISKFYDEQSEAFRPLLELPRRPSAAPPAAPGGAARSPSRAPAARRPSRPTDRVATPPREAPSPQAQEAGGWGTGPIPVVKPKPEPVPQRSSAPPHEPPTPARFPYTAPRAPALPSDLTLDVDDEPYEPAPELPDGPPPSLELTHEDDIGVEFTPRQLGEPLSVPPPPATPPPEPETPPESRARESDSSLPPALAPEKAQKKGSDRPHTPVVRAVRVPTVAPPVRRQRPSGTLPRLESLGDAFQLAVVLVSILESDRADLRGHSVKTARWVRRACEVLDIPPLRARAAETAALVHDIGKPSGSEHLTALSVAHLEPHRAAASKLHATPLHLLQSAHLAKAATHTIEHMYERYDGGGLPDGLEGEDIPVESRILAICDSYADLTSNPHNCLRELLGPRQACEALHEFSGAIFDPDILRRFSRIVLTEDLEKHLRGEQGKIVIVDPNAADTTVLDLALTDAGYPVQVARNPTEASDLFGAIDSVALVIAEWMYPRATGEELLRQVHAGGAEGLPPVIFVSDSTDPEDVRRAMKAGAADYLFKPVDTEEIITKVGAVVNEQRAVRRARGIRGSLEQLSLADVVQVMHRERQSGCLAIDPGSAEGRVYFEDGAIVHCSSGNEVGEAAFHHLMTLGRGSFGIEPSAKPPSRTIDAKPGTLLLEAMRRLDDSGR